MFFKTKRNRRKTTRQTLSTEQLEPKAMFSVSPVEPVVALDVGPVNQAGYDCTNAGTCSGIWTNGGASTLRIGGTAGPGGSSFMPGINSRAQANQAPSLIGDSDRPGDVGTSFEDRTTSDHDRNDITLHASANPNAAPDSFIKLGDIKGEFQLTQRVGSSAGSGGDDIFMPKAGRKVSLHDSVHCLVGGVGKGAFTTGAGSDSIIHPRLNVGEDGRTIVHPKFSVGEGVLAQANQQPNVANVWTNGSATSMAPRHAAFARMGR